MHILVPVLFYTSLGSVGKSLRVSNNIDQRHPVESVPAFFTFAISPQLLPASLMVFSRCSSAGLHGVLVLLFFGADTGVPVLANVSLCSPTLPSSTIGFDNDPAIAVVPGAFRFRDGGELACG